MRNNSAPRRLPQEPLKGTNAGQGNPFTTPRPPDLNRLAADLAAEWCCRHEENEIFEVAL